MIYATPRIPTPPFSTQVKKGSSARSRFSLRSRHAKEDNLALGQDIVDGTVGKAVKVML